MDHLIQAYAAVGSQSKLARAIGVVPQVVHNWQRRGKVPAEYCPAIEKATDGAIRCEDLRPDVDWSVLRCNCAEKAAA